MEEWRRLKARNPRARMVCIDLQPYRTVQATHDDDVLNVGGFSDQVFEVAASFARGGFAGEHWLRIIEETAI
jgi:60 kDa SS-A/Ro ribonucleoprotein